MITLLSAVLALAVQDSAAEIQKQAGRIGAKDAKASFDAVARLVDLASSSRKEVEEAVAKLPEEAAFYRKVLAEELATRDRLGAKYGKVTRVSLDFKEKAAQEAIAELSEKSKEKIDTLWAFRQGEAVPPVTLKVDDATFMEALHAVCKEAKLNYGGEDGGVVLYTGGFEPPDLCMFRNFSLAVQGVERTRRVKFGEAGKRTVGVQLRVTWDGQAGVVIARSADLIEAVDDQGRALQADPVGPDEVQPGMENSAENVVSGGWYGQVRMKAPAKDAEKIARLRGSVTMLVATSSATLTMTLKEGKADAVSDTDVELELVPPAAQQMMGGKGGFWIEQDEMKLRVKPKKGTLEDLKKTPLAFTVKLKGNDERSTTAYGTVVDGAIEYLLYPRMNAMEQDRGETPAIESITVTMHRATTERKVYFEFRDLSLK